jgi:Na+-driven multidrug efflux pump
MLTDQLHIGHRGSGLCAYGVGHWAVGLPLGLYFGFSRGMGVPGIWIGLAAGLTFVAVSLVYVWLRESSRPTPKIG